jgi:hypothetical protein
MQTLFWGGSIFIANNPSLDDIREFTEDNALTVHVLDTDFPTIGTEEMNS